MAKGTISADSAHRIDVNTLSNETLTVGEGSVAGDFEIANSETFLRAHDNPTEL